MLKNPNSDMDVILDTDLNFPSDDFQALLLTVQHSAWNVLGCCAAAGNTWSEEVWVNIRHVLNMAGRSDIVTAYGAPFTTFVDRYTWAHQLKQRKVRSFIGAYGKNAKPRTGLCPAGYESLQKISALDFLIANAQSNPGELDLLCIAPLTNVAQAFRKEPGLSERIRSIYIMGGAFYRPEECAGAVDFNFWFDPQAAQAVLNSGVKIILLPLNVCQATSIDSDFLSSIQDIRQGIAGLFVQDLFALADQHGCDMPLWDQLLVLLAMKPDLITKMCRGSVNVETSRSDQCGDSTFIPGASGTVHVVEAVNRSAVYNELRSALNNMQHINNASQYSTVEYIDE